MFDEIVRILKESFGLVEDSLDIPGNPLGFFRNSLEFARILNKFSGLTAEALARRDIACHRPETGGKPSSSDTLLESKYFIRIPCKSQEA